MGKSNLGKSVGKAIAGQRKLAGLTQAEVADKLGVEKETVSRMETGVISPSLERLQQLADILGCTVRQFFWHETGSERAQSDTIADMIRSLPAHKRALAVRFVAELTRVLREG